MDKATKFPEKTIVRVSNDTHTGSPMQPVCLSHQSLLVSPPSLDKKLRPVAQSPNHHQPLSLFHTLPEDPSSVPAGRLQAVGARAHSYCLASRCYSEAAGSLSGRAVIKTPFFFPRLSLKAHTSMVWLAGQPAGSNQQAFPNHQGRKWGTAELCFSAWRSS